MAKTKIKSIRPEKISDEQLKKVHKVLDAINQHQIDIGMIETRKHNLLHNVAGLQDELTLLRDKFDKEYGTVDINVQNGIINYPSNNGKTDKKN